METLLKNKSFLILFALIVPAIVMFHRLGESPLGGDDCYYSEVSKEMARAGDYLTPRNGGSPDFHTSKPPMLFWMNALSGNIFGFDTFAMRLPSAALGYLGVIALFFFVRRYFNIETAFLSALILTFTQQYLYHSRSAVTDGPFAVFFALSLFSFWAAVTENKTYLYYLWGLFLAAAVMTRQLPGFFILAVICAYVLFSRRWRLLKNPHIYGAFMLSIALILPWHLIMFRKYGVHFLDQYFGVTFITAFKGYPAGYSSSASLNPWYAYFEILLSNYEPWLILLLMGFYKVVNGFGSFDDKRKDSLTFLLCWCFAPLVIFQLAKVKQYHYIMPLYIPFAVIAADAVNGFGERAKKNVTAALAILTFLLAVSYVIYPIIPKTLDSREYVENLKMVPELKKLDGDVYALRHGFSYFNNCFWFYADKRSVLCTEDELAAAINGQKKIIFVLLKEDIDGIKNRVTKPLNTVKETSDSVLFTN